MHREIRQNVRRVRFEPKHEEHPPAELIVAVFVDIAVSA